MLRTTNQTAIWNTLFVSICERKDWAVIYFDAVHRCSTDRNVHISTDEFRKKETKWGIFAYWVSRNPFDAVHISSKYSRYSVDSDLSHSWSKKFRNAGNVRIDNIDILGSS